MSLGARLQKARLHAGLTQKQLEARAGVSQKTISKIERGDQAVSSAAVQLATACGVRPEWLAASDGPMLGPPKVEQPRAKYGALSDEALEVARTWQGLPKSQRDRIREHLYMAAFAAGRSGKSTGVGRARSFEDFRQRLMREGAAKAPAEKRRGGPK
jgi:transcriptional regulator with XRE-family HTH domain